MTEQIFCSVVVPVFNSEGCLEELAERLVKVFQQQQISYELILINDYSKDQSWNKIKIVAQKNNQIKGINFRKNFGQDSALISGLRYAQGKYVIIMDDDLQHSPEDIPLLISEIEKGYDVVFANFFVKHQKWWKNWGSWFNGKMAEMVIRKPAKIYLSPFKILIREVVDEIIKYDGPYPYIDGLIFTVTGHVSQIDVHHQGRYSGQSNYNVIRSLRVWLNLSTSFSIIPLRIANLLGFVSALMGFSLTLLFLYEKFHNPANPLGWASQIIATLFIGGVQLICIGILGEYLGRLYLKENKNPQFVIKEKVNL